MPADFRDILAQMAQQQAITNQVFSLPIRPGIGGALTGAGQAARGIGDLIRGIRDKPMMDEVRAIAMKNEKAESEALDLGLQMSKLTLDQKTRDADRSVRNIGGSSRANTGEPPR